MNIGDNILRVRERIKAAAERAGRDPAGIMLVAVTKEASDSQIREAVAAGQEDLGENRVQEALRKINLLNAGVSPKPRHYGDSVRWHMIGHLQTNKARDAVSMFDLIHSVDSVKLAEKINSEAKKTGKKQNALIEVNVSGEKSKFGIPPEELPYFLKETKKLENIEVMGLMAMAPFSDNAENSRPFFRKLKELAKKNNLSELSMGMTQDFEVAVEEGATMVRIGSAIFKCKIR